MFNQILRFTGSQQREFVENNEETSRFITFGYYYRATDWSVVMKKDNRKLLYQDTPIGFRYPKIDDFRDDQNFLEVYQHYK